MTAVILASAWREKMSIYDVPKKIIFCILLLRIIFVVFNIFVQINTEYAFKYFK